MAKRPGIELLEGVPLFEGLPPRHLRRIRDIAEPADYMAGASLVKQGAPGDSFFVIIEGEAKVVVGSRTINRLTPGDYFGEISLLDGGARTASVMSETPLKVLMIERKRFLKLLHDEGAIAVALLEGMARAIRRTDRSLAV